MTENKKARLREEIEHLKRTQNANPDLNHQNNNNYHQTIHHEKIELENLKEELK